MPSQRFLPQLDGETEDDYAARLVDDVRQRIFAPSVPRAPLPPPPDLADVIKGATPGMVIYFARCLVERGPVKVGLTADVARRIAELQVGCPYEIQVMGVIPGSREGEKMLHRYLTQFRLQGEWFKGAPEVIRTVKALLRAARAKAQVAA